MLPVLTKRVLDLAIAIQQIPAPTFKETARAEFVREKFRAEGLADVQQDALGNVFAHVPGKRSARPVVVTAHLDTVFPIQTELKLECDPEKIAGPGIGDNSLGVAGLFGLLWALQAEDHRVARSSKALRLNFPGDLWLVANVCEEGLGDLRGMQVVVERFQAGPRAYLVLEGISLGQVYHRGLGVRRYRINAETKGGHSWVDYGRPSAVHELACLVTHLASLPLPTQPRTTLNVGVLSGGTSVNTIASHASLELDLRSETVAGLTGLVSQVDELVVSSNRSDVRFSMEAIGQRPAGQIAADHPLVRLATQSLEAAGVPAALNIGSTDANLPLSLGFPAICLALTNGGGAHTLEEYILKQPLAQGLKQLQLVVEGAFREL